MSAMGGSDFYDYVLRIFKRTDKSTEVYEAITDALMEIKLLYAFEDFKEEAYTGGITALGEYKLAVPTDFGHLLGNVMLIDDSGNSRELTKRTKQTFDSMYPNPNASDVNKNIPSDFCIFSGQILLGDVPDSVDYNYQFSYSTEEATTIVSGTTSVPFTDRYRWVIRAKVLEMLYYGLGYDEEAAKWQNKAIEGISLMVANDVFNTDATEQVDYQGV